MRVREHGWQSEFGNGGQHTKGAQVHTKHHFVTSLEFDCLHIINLDLRAVHILMSKKHGPLAPIAWIIIRVCLGREGAKEALDSWLWRMFVLGCSDFDIGTPSISDAGVVTDTVQLNWKCRCKLNKQK